MHVIKLDKLDYQTTDASRSSAKKTGTLLIVPEFNIKFKRIGDR